ncbi:hypothetical protein DPMN_107307 [Dreissena polymorpha]|uniref:Uncharacterized protein n=1 Tax=Dreissena polymorpha TaxID=45954 RepID=A0A9D4K6U2_DREPO|nr:hypothetical protein DPMN_107307 [Dreissena polymorpha]
MNTIARQAQTQDIIRTNVLTKFHEELTINVTFRVLTRINSLPPGGHVFQQKGTIFELIQDIIRTNVLTKFYEDWKINVSLRVLTRIYHSHIKKILNHFKLIQYIIRTNLLTKFYEHWTINMTNF